MRKRVWKLHYDSYHKTFPSPAEGRFSMMSGAETHIRYMWREKAANIFGTAFIIRATAWRSTKAWFKKKWEAIDWSVVFYYGMLALSFSVLVFSLWAIADHEGMI